MATARIFRLFLSTFIRFHRSMSGSELVIAGTALEAARFYPRAHCAGDAAQQPHAPNAHHSEPTISSQ